VTITLYLSFILSWKPSLELNWDN